jgi:5,5'-dehydrodivanillate O-demethylase oxygenase subunit
MLTAEENALLTGVSRGTPMGGLLRRYWFPVAASGEMTERWTKRVRLLGEDLVLFKDRGGRFGLIAEFCPHRRASLAYGIPTVNGIRCPYHGWEFDGRGTCLEQPNEPAESTLRQAQGRLFKDKVTTAGYPVEELGGMLFAYLGPLPAPLVPRLDGFVVDGAIRLVAKCVVRCNWLQIMENSMDPIHAEWLHGHLQEHVDEQAGAKYSVTRHHLDIAFAEFEYGVYKRRLLEGQPIDSDDWRVGHPVIFPNILAVGSADEHMRMISFQIRVPMDDEHTMHYWYYALVPPPWADVPEKLLREIPAYDMPFTDERGEYLLDFIDGQDIMAWETQGALADRRREHLGTGDRGVILWRQILHRELKKLAAGADPMCVLRDPAQNEIIELHVEKGKAAFKDGFASLLRRMPLRYAPIADDLLAVFAAPAPTTPAR